LLDCIAAENERRGGMKCPGGAHVA
jgi:hypothetical protein